MNFNVYLTKVKTGVIPFSGSTSKGINILRSLQKWQLYLLEAIKGQIKKTLQPGSVKGSLTTLIKGSCCKKRIIFRGS